jgi:hypothetical protein
MRRPARWRLDKAKVRVRHRVDRSSLVIDQRQDEQGDRA